MTVVVTRPGDAGQELVAMLEHNNISAIHLPLFTFTHGPDLHLLPQVLASLNVGDWLFPVSTQAIEFADNELKKQQQTWPSHIHYLAVGKKSAEKLSTITQQNVLYPAMQESSEGLLALLENIHLSQEKFLILRANNGRDLLANYLRHRGTEVKILTCYNRIPIFYQDLNTINIVKNATIFVVTSLANLIALDKLFKNYCISYKDRKLVTISPRLILKAGQLGWENIQLSPKVNNQFLYNTVQSIYK